MLRYIQQLELTKTILWCYLIWYFAIISQYFDATLDLWLSSVGIAVIIGFALNLAAAQKNQRLCPWIRIRLYIFPFCVSSYSALIKGNGFFLLFPTDLKPLLLGSFSVLAFLSLVFVVKASRRKSHVRKV